MHFEWKLKLRTHDASYYQILEMVNKAGLTIVAMYFQDVDEITQKIKIQEFTEKMKNMNLNKGNK